MKPKKQFKPQDLRTLLSLLLAIVVIGGAAVFYFGLGMLRDYSTQVNQELANANGSGKQIEELQVLKNQLSQSNSLITKANELFATPANYRSRTLTDIKNYADAAGISIESTNFESDTTHTVTVTLVQPVNYSKLIVFLNNIESNLPKMQVQSISLQRIEGGSADSVKVGPIKIDVSVM